ncbi:Hypothetical predicted protein [Paramuricea clavata]|uniref:Uncharacterized protein n=1 Tax=Paramuricea clavata TaxID=317549 RepID=A0A6S7IVR8_PARCT|nr:Hypothetical predicted protein [Paramuricea clavata]
MSSSNASCRLDPFPTWLVKKCVDQLAPLITKMINSSLESGTVPENWKVALIVPILKKFGLDLVFMNFRPISNLPFVSKTAEKVVVLQILDHCSAHAPLAACQSSYRKHHSTETALLKVQNDILLSMDRQEVTLLVLLDLSAAFDTIDHDIMINLLENDFGITDQALSWLKSFLSGRKQRVVIGQQQSEDFDLISGVPQGSCLGPILFIIPNRWSKCPVGYFLNGLQSPLLEKSHLASIADAKCCKLQGFPGDYSDCYEEDVSKSFHYDKAGMSQCSKERYFIAGLYKANCNQMYCIGKFLCCRMEYI